MIQRGCVAAVIRPTHVLGRSLVLGLTAACLMRGLPASAAIIIQDQFDYATGSLKGQNGGQGFSAAWQATSSLQVTSPGLTYGTLETSGNAIIGLNSGSMRRLFDNTGLTGDGATYWFSVLFAAPEATASTATSIPSFFSDATLGNGQSSGFAVSFNPTRRTKLYMDARIGGSVRAGQEVPGTDYYTGSFLVLGRITFSDTAGQDRLEVWLDPSLSGDPGTPLFNVTGTWVDPGANNSFYMNKYDAPDRSVDEIRLGTSLADVMPVPEPTTLGLIGPLALALYHRVRRRFPRRS